MSKRTTKAKDLIAAGGYIRMSSDQQENSPERQREEITRLAERDGYRIVEWYQDDGQTGTESAKRKDFQRMLADAKRGTFKALLVHEQSRFSREKVLKVFQHLMVLDDFGISLVTTRRGAIDFNDIGDMVTTLVEAHAAREESIKIADRCVGGKQLKAERGDRSCYPVFGYDREMIDEDGVVIKRVRCHERFMKPKAWRSRLVLSSDVRSVEAVRFAFATMHAGGSQADVLRQFIKWDLRTSQGNPFNLCNIKLLLRNAVYAGDLVSGEWSRGQFRRIDEQGIVIKRNAHPAIVERRIFDEVQAMMSTFRRAHTKPILGEHVLSRLVVCGHCGRTMWGAVCRRADGGPAVMRHYWCTRRQRESIDRPVCGVRPTVQAEQLEQFVIRHLEMLIASEGNAQPLMKAIQRKRDAAKNANDPNSAEAQANDLRQRITKGEHNLGLCDSPDDFRAVSDQLKKWREQLAAIELATKSRAESELVKQTSLATLRRLLPITGKLTPADRAALAQTIAAIVEQVTVWRSHAPTGIPGYAKCATLCGEIVFKTGADMPPVRFTDYDIAPVPKAWRQVQQFILSKGGAEWSEVRKRFHSMGASNLRRALKVCVAQGSVLVAEGRKWSREHKWISNPAYDPYGAMSTAPQPRYA